MAKQIPPRAEDLLVMTIFWVGVRFRRHEETCRSRVSPLRGFMVYATFPRAYARS